MAAPEPAPRPFLVPWGLILLVPLYLLAVGAVLLVHYIWSEDYQAARHWTAAKALLGHDQGRGLPLAQLEQTDMELIEAAEAKPEVRDFQEALEHVQWRFDDLHAKPPLSLLRRAEATGRRFAEIEQERRPILVVGARDRGWAPDQWMDGPLHFLVGAAVGLGLLLILVAHGWNTRRQVAVDDGVAEQRRREGEVKDLGRFRER